eukprot:CAMPEP_0168510870 /NCGR_PEP_ID=MMETSP0405-20121227/1747_1 /TAXON_ID=498012 /ORGANISM="Trichosphaerium sp, Strain Am-I-7 wt" /LENGTH=342 /DNA_ID=CAMNT_0008528839 /DNA_START=156 /DNA_END=1184 /DNA_ORIENTATION=-
MTRLSALRTLTLTDMGDKAPPLDFITDLQRLDHLILTGPSGHKLRFGSSEVMCPRVERITAGTINGITLESFPNLRELCIHVQGLELIHKSLPTLMDLQRLVIKGEHSKSQRPKRLTGSSFDPRNNPKPERVIEILSDFCASGITLQELDFFIEDWEPSTNEDLIFLSTIGSVHITVYMSSAQYSTVKLLEALKFDNLRTLRIAFSSEVPYVKIAELTQLETLQVTYPVVSKGFGTRSTGFGRRKTTYEPDKSNLSGLACLASMPNLKNLVIPLSISTNMVKDFVAHIAQMKRLKHVSVSIAASCLSDVVTLCNVFGIHCNPFPGIGSMSRFSTYGTSLSRR